MTSRVPLLIATLPGHTLAELRADQVAAVRAGADLAEVRIDRLPAAERASMADLFPSPLPLLATYRSRTEGGQGDDDPVARGVVLGAAAGLPFAAIDLEAARDAALVGHLPGEGRRTVLLSAHLPVEVALDDLLDRLAHPLPPRTVSKVVFPCSIGRWLSEIRPHLKDRNAADLVLMATGPAGPLSRAWARRSGLFAVFGAIPSSVAEPSLRPPVEASQLPIDRMRTFFEAGEGAPLVGLAGRPVAHSRSPDLYARFQDGTGRAGLYLLLEFADDREFVSALPGLAAGGFRGLNVTHPFKDAALVAASRVDRAAEICGVANCLSFDGDRIEAQNTDLAAILRRLGELRRSGRWNGRALAVVGAGGAARATLAAARELGAVSTVFARRPEAASDLARAFGATVGDPESCAAASLLVHATPAGRAGSPPLALPLDRLVDADTHVLDWVYAPEDRALPALAHEARASYEDGWRMLVYQAAASFGVWWDQEPSPEAVDAAVEAHP